MNYIKLKEITSFSVVDVYPPQYQKYENGAFDKKTAKEFFALADKSNYKKQYGVICNNSQDILTLSSNQFAILLELVSEKGAADIKGKTFKVSNNGEPGKEIRYYFKYDYSAPSNFIEPVQTNEDNSIDLEDIPF